MDLDLISLISALRSRSCSKTKMTDQNDCPDQPGIDILAGWADATSRGRVLGWKQHHVRDATPSFTFQPFLIYSETPIETD